MKKLILGGLTVLILSGCNFQVTQASIDKAAEVCKQNGGVKWVKSEVVDYYVDVKCNNAAYFDNVRSGGR